MEEGAHSKSSTRKRARSQGLGNLMNTHRACRAEGLAAQKIEGMAQSTVISHVVHRVIKSFCKVSLDLAINCKWSAYTQHQPYIAK